MNYCHNKTVKKKESVNRLVSAIFKAKEREGNHRFITVYKNMCQAVWTDRRERAEIQSHTRLVPLFPRIRDQGLLYQNPISLFSKSKVSCWSKLKVDQKHETKQTNK